MFTQSIKRSSRIRRTFPNRKITQTNRIFQHEFVDLRRTHVCTCKYTFPSICEHNKRVFCRLFDCLAGKSEIFTVFTCCAPSRNWVTITKPAADLKIQNSKRNLQGWLSCCIIYVFFNESVIFYLNYGFRAYYLMTCVKVTIEKFSYSATKCVIHLKQNLK